MPLPTPIRRLLAGRVTAQPSGNALRPARVVIPRWRLPATAPA